jgi:tetratricopeptide (TPR) repeat protein
MFTDLLQKKGIQWSAIDNLEQRRDIALQELTQLPVLWIWDSIEPVTGFPAGTESAWSTTEQDELVDFLRTATDHPDTKAKFLLTSRRDERVWLHGLPMRVPVPHMPMQERMALTKALAEKQGHKISEVEDWRPLLRYTQGNPLTITVLVNQALVQGLTTHDKIEQFVADLTAGETQFADVDESEGRTRSLTASLRYGFENGFSEDERKILALLHLFQGCVSASTLAYMGTEDQDWAVDAVRAMTPEQGIVMLDRAAQAGLLTAVGEGVYTIHPALPWYFGQLFAAYYAAAREHIERAYVAATGHWGQYFHEQAWEGNPNDLAPLALEEDNLLAARRLALEHGWLKGIVTTMEGLSGLLLRVGRKAEWQTLVEEIIPTFVDPATDLACAGVDEDSWGLVTSYRVLLAKDARLWLDAERLAHLYIDLLRRRARERGEAAGMQSAEAYSRDAAQKLALFLCTLGEIQIEQGKSEGLQALTEAADLLEHIGDRCNASVVALSLGTAYADLPSIRDLDKAEMWYKRSLDSMVDGDDFRKSFVLGNLSSITLDRFHEGMDAGAPEVLQILLLFTAGDYCRRALALLPADAFPELAKLHNLLGNIYAGNVQPDRARACYDYSIALHEQVGDVLGAAITRENVALLLAPLRRFDDALVYAEAALRGFQSIPNAEDRVQRAQQLIDHINRDMQGGNSP